jgi:hypothetical protein
MRKSCEQLASNELSALLRMTCGARGVGRVLRRRNAARSGLDRQLLVLANHAQQLVRLQLHEPANAHNTRTDRPSTPR